MKISKRGGRGSKRGEEKEERRGREGGYQNQPLLQ
jgi:hypothetical protein